MDNYFLTDVYNIDRFIIKARTQKHAEKAFYNKFLYKKSKKGRCEKWTS